MDRTIQQLVDEALEGFTCDPPDTPFQEGYLAAIQWLKKELDERRTETLN